MIATIRSYYFQLKFLPGLPPADLDSDANQKALQRYLRPLLGNLLECREASDSEVLGRKYGPPVELTIYSWENDTGDIQTDKRLYNIFGCVFNGERI
jgi:hypothetical protein